RGGTPAPKGALSIYDPIYLGLDARGRSVRVGLMYRNILIGGEPGAGKSVAQGNIVAHAALCIDVDLILIDGKIVELLPYAPVASQFVGNDMTKALRVLLELQKDLDERYLHLARTGRKKIVPGDGFRAKLLCIDELAYFTVTVGTKEQQEEFRTLVRDIVARGRAAGIITVASTQRPS
ncbi:FtsK/SpoIIIE domain-containing protein, partial [Luedemannella flava]|uniref:FtsK/SpoIIIE domain-containing protein n=1 Tax=Luedemannella flava TaxID=349316 RepID=UPI0031D6EBC7